MPLGMRGSCRSGAASDGVGGGLAAVEISASAAVASLRLRHLVRARRLSMSKRCAADLGPPAHIVMRT